MQYTAIITTTTTTATPV